MIAITFALPTESSGLRRHFRDIRQDENMVSGTIGDHAVTISHTGVGAKKGNERIEALLHKARPRLVISTGFAGAVAEGLHVGDLILAENFSDRHLLNNAERILHDHKPKVAELFTSTSIVDSVVERNQIARESGAAAVDMETGTIVGICNAHGVPLLSLRAISDSPTEPFPAPPSVLFDIERQRPNYPLLILYLFRYPASIASLSQFGRRIARVRKTLTEAIIALITEI
jgi:adenosylhomocysteine nucleosidase